MTKSYLRTDIGERVEQSDFEHATSTSQKQIIQTIMTDLVTGDAVSAQGQPLNYVIDGFVTSVVGTTVTVTGGKAIVGFRDAVAEFGMLISGGAASRNRDMNNLDNGIYGVFVRGSFPKERFLNRLFWNALAVTPAETPRSIGTRKTENWEIAIEQTSPGPEYLQVAQATKVGASITLLDKRVWLFEGKISNAYAAVDAEWGGGNDRNTDRSLYGVKSFARAFRGLFRQVQDIIGGSPLQWYKAINGTLGSGPRSLTQLNEEKFDRDGDQTFSGDFLPSIDNSLDMGSAAARWEAIYGRIIRLISPPAGNGAQIHIEGEMTTGDGGETARVSIPFSQGAGVNRTNLLESFGFTSSTSTFCRIYRAVSSTQLTQANTLEFVFNARYDNNTDTWIRDFAGDAFKLEINLSQISILKRLAASTSPWADNAWDEVLLTVSSSSLSTRQVLSIVSAATTARFKSTHALSSTGAPGERILVKEVINTTDSVGYREYVYQNNAEWRLERVSGCSWNGTNWVRDGSVSEAHMVREGSAQNARYTKYTNLATPWTDAQWDACDRAFGRIVTTAGPAAVSSTVGFNIGTPTFVGGTLELEVAFLTPMISAPYTIVISDESQDGSIQYKPYSITDTAFSIRGWNDGAVIDFDVTAARINFWVKGPIA